MRYYVQFPAGTGSLVRRALPPLLGPVRTGYADASAMIVDSGASPTTVAAIPFVTNAFVVVAGTPRGDADHGVRQLGRIARQREFPALHRSWRGFRVMVHLDGSLAPVGAAARSALERTVAARTGLRVEPRGRGQEFWVVGRRGLGDLLLCARLPKAAQPPTARGSVSPALAAMLVATSQPAAGDVFLDPFAGRGSFVAARLAYPARQLWCSDLHLDQYRADLGDLARDHRVRLLSEDALTLPSVADGSVDVIVTDPPWGEYEDLGRAYEDFATDLGASVARVLRPETGRFVLLVNRRNAVALGRGLARRGLRVAEEHEILVNGHPATVMLGH